MLSLRMRAGEENLSGSESVLSSSPGSKSAGADGGSDLFKKVLEDYVLDQSTRISKYEFDRYSKSKYHKSSEEHTASKRCESCQAVTAFCKCDLYHGQERTVGHRVHWADEVWNKPLQTAIDDDKMECEADTHGLSHTEPKPILKHRATCIVVVSD